MAVLIDLAVLGRRIREARKARGISQKEAANEGGFAQGAWSFWEQGAHRPTMANLEVIARVVRLHPRDLLLPGPPRRKRRSSKAGAAARP